MHKPKSDLAAATLVIFANALGLVGFLLVRTDRLLTAVVDPRHPDRVLMERAFGGYSAYAVALLSVVALGIVLGVRSIARRVRGPAGARVDSALRETLRTVALAVVPTTCIILAFVEVLIFQDYGVHLYEFDVFGVLAAAPLRRYLGIQPAEVIRVTVASFTVLALQLVLFAGAFRLGRWRGGAFAGAAAVLMVAAIPIGFGVYRITADRITVDRNEFESALPMSGLLLFRVSPRPFIAVEPRLGTGGYPVLAAADLAPRVTRKSNIVFVVSDGLRGDMFTPELMPNLTAMAARPDAIRSQRHVSTGHVSEIGVFGLLFGIRGQNFHSFMSSRVPSYPITVLKRNGYHTFFLSSSRLSPYPSDGIATQFDEVAFPANDDDAVAALDRYVAARRVDGRPYFVLAFVYTPHYPFTSAKPAFQRFPLIGPEERSNYMNDVMQADDYIGQLFSLVRGDFDAGRTAFLATGDHGEELREHGMFGHAPPTFWNEKIIVPFVIALPGTPLTRATRSPALTSHVDAWPTLFDYLGVVPRMPPSQLWDGRSLLDAPAAPVSAYVSGRFFPYADRPSVLVDGARKYWFRARGVAASGRVCIEVTRVTDLADRPVDVAPSTVDERAVPAFVDWQRSFWRFIKPAEGRAVRRAAGDCR